jgi:hypothetical protein
MQLLFENRNNLSQYRLNDLASLEIAKILKSGVVMLTVFEHK